VVRLGDGLLKSRPRLEGMGDFLGVAFGAGVNGRLGVGSTLATVSSGFRLSSGFRSPLSLGLGDASAAERLEVDEGDEGVSHRAEIAAVSKSPTLSAAASPTSAARRRPQGARNENHTILSVPTSAGSKCQ
jgi:hypothetical protein